MARMMHARPARKVVICALVAGVSVALAGPLGASLLPAPLPTFAVAVLTAVLTLAVGYVVPPHPDDGVVAHKPARRVTRIGRLQ